MTNVPPFSSQCTKYTKLIISVPDTQSVPVQVVPACRACLSRHLYALLHPQKSLGSLSFGDPSELLRPIFKYLRASSQDCTNREATDRQQAGRNHTYMHTRTHTRSHTLQRRSQIPKWCSTTKNKPDDTIYHSSTALI